MHFCTFSSLLLGHTLFSKKHNPVRLLISQSARSQQWRPSVKPVSQLLFSHMGSRAGEEQVPPHVAFGVRCFISCPALRMPDLAPSSITCHLMHRWCASSSLRGLTGRLQASEELAQPILTSLQAPFCTDEGSDSKKEGPLGDCQGEPP